MQLDTMAGFEMLREHGLRVARSKYVDSAEDAISFAERRGAADPRLGPIALRMAGAPVPDWRLVRQLNSEAAIRRSYALVAKEATGSHVLAQSLPSGVDVTIVGEFTGERSVITVRPPNDHHGAREGIRRMFGHIVEHLREMLGEGGLVALDVTVRLHEGAYTIIDAQLIARRAPALRPRLGRHAHDRKEYGFRPSGKQ